MPASLVQGDSLLAVDIGGATTHAVLFDVVEGEYRFLAASSAPSTAEAPYKDILDGVRNAISGLQNVTGRVLLDADGRLVTPTQSDGSGVDSLVSTLSAGPALKTVIVGLLSDVSLESARRLAETTYTRLVDSMGINDHRKPDEQIDALMRLQPDVVIITGGTDGGASRSIRKMLEPVGLSGFLLTPEKRPAVLFAGNQKLDDEVKELLGSVTSALHFSSNVRPSLETEDLEPGRANWPICISGSANASSKAWTSWPPGRAGTSSPRLMQRGACCAFWAGSIPGKEAAFSAWILAPPRR